MGQLACHSKPTLKAKRFHVNCFYFTTDSWPGSTTSTRKKSMCLAVMESPHTHTDSQRTRTKLKVCNSNPCRLVSLILMLAGDIETNPGPGKSATNRNELHCTLPSIEYQEYVDHLGEASCYLKKTLDWDHPADLDLERISNAMGTNWEIDYSSSLGFTQIQVDDLKQVHHNDHPALLRYVLCNHRVDHPALLRYY